MEAAGSGVSAVLGCNKNCRNKRYHTCDAAQKLNTIADARILISPKTDHLRSAFGSA